MACWARLLWTAMCVGRSYTEGRTLKQGNPMNPKTCLQLTSASQEARAIVLHVPDLRPKGCTVLSGCAKLTVQGKIQPPQSQESQSQSALLVHAVVGRFSNFV